MRLEADGVVEALLVVDSDDVGRADADAVAREADAHVLARAAVVVEEGLERMGERGLVLDVAVDDDPGLERDARGLEELGAPVDLLHDGCRELRGADLETDDLAAAALAAP